MGVQLNNKLPLESSLLKDLSYLSPNSRLREYTVRVTGNLATFSFSKRSVVG